MKTNWIRTGLLSFSLYFLAAGHHPLIRAEEFLIEKEIAGRMISFKFKNSETAQKFMTFENFHMIQEILKNIIFFESETRNSQQLQLTGYEFDFSMTSTPWDFFDLIFTAFLDKPDQKQVVRKMRILETKSEMGRVLRFKIQNLDSEKPDTQFYEVINFEFDPEGRIMNRIILHLQIVSNLIQFRGGKWIEYRDMNAQGLPASSHIKSFILDKDGRKIWLDAKEVFERNYHENGLVSRESTRITTYRYSDKGLGKDYSIYNVIFHPSREISHYEVIFLKNSSEPELNRQGLEIDFYRSEEGYLHDKLIRKFEISSESKKYLDGRLHTWILENARIISSRELFFKIKEGCDGTKEDEKIYREALYTWNQKFDSQGNVLKKKILQTHFEEMWVDQELKTIELLDSLKNIRIKRDTRGVKILRVDYLDLDSNHQFHRVRRVRILVSQRLLNGDPLQILLSIESPQDPTSRDESLITQDCGYIMNEAMVGNLFDLTYDRNYAVQLKGVSQDGEKIKARIFYALEIGGKKIYSRTPAEVVADPTS